MNLSSIPILANSTVGLYEYVNSAYFSINK